MNRASTAIKVALCGTALHAAVMSSSKAQESWPTKDMEIIIGFGPGGSYDLYARLIARHMGRQLPGSPNVVPKNMPGAGSARAANYLAVNAPQDGTSLGMLGDGLHLSQQLGEARIQFNFLNLKWIGRITNNTPVLFSWHSSPITSTQDLMTKKMIVAAEGDTPKLNYTLLQSLVGLRIDTISGYKSTGEALLAMERGEVHGVAMPWPVVIELHGELVREKKIIPILHTGAERHKTLQDVPRMIDLAKNDQDRKVFELIAQTSRIGRSVVAPPGVPAARITILRRAFLSAVQDPGFLVEAQKQNLDLAILDGEQLETLVKEAGDYPDAVIDKAKAAMAQLKVGK